uniref:DSBA domain-containing protein n=1 Tax=Macrostomum lignano TaxID=282301 RepID=A0A1I8FPE5_9PLAT
MNDRVVEIMFNTGTLSTMRFLTALQQNAADAVEPVSRQLFYRLFSSHQDVAQPDSLRAAAEAAGLSADVTAAAADRHVERRTTRDVAQSQQSEAAAEASGFVKADVTAGRPDRHVERRSVEYKGPLMAPSETLRYPVPLIQFFAFSV